MKFKSSFLLLFVCIIGFLIAFFLLKNTNKGSPKPSEKNDSLLTTKADFEAGKRLATSHCSTCHTFPEPSLLDKKTWISQTLPNMGPRFGIFSHNGEKYPVEKTPNLPENIYPDQQLLSHKEWQQILDYYNQAAPDTLPVPGRKDITVNSLFFKARTPNFRAQTPPMVTAIRLDSARKSIYFSDASKNQFYIFDRNLRFENRFALTSAISDIQIVNGSNANGRTELLTTFIGDVNPSDAPQGFIQPVWYNFQTQNGGANAVLMDSLVRPVQTQWVDLNQDTQKDLLVNEFGHRSGKLFWLEKTGSSLSSQKNVLINTPGCIESHVADLHMDKLPDVIALCSQLNQAIYLFKNEGNGTFSREKLLQFEIVAGSSSFKLHDFNNDGALDILYTSGDNADYSITYKPYHGIYIYLNDGRNHFSQGWFYPNNGAYNAVASDFDGDGDSDIAAISFFADYDNNPDEGFIYFQNEGNLSFAPYHPPATSNGRWIAMDVADWTGNGRADIVLANFSLGPTRVNSLVQKKFTDAPHFLLLENRVN